MTNKLEPFRKLLHKQARRSGYLDIISEEDILKSLVAYLSQRTITKTYTGLTNKEQIIVQSFMIDLRDSALDELKKLQKEQSID